MNKVEAMTVAFGRFLNTAVALGGFAAMTHFLPPSEYALVALLNVFVAFAGLLLINPSGQWLQRHLHEWHNTAELAERLRENLIYWASVASLVGAAAAVWYGALISHDLILSLSVGGAVVAVILFSTGAQTYSAVANALGHRMAAVACGTAAAGLPLLFAVLAVAWRVDGVSWFGGQAVGAAVAFWSVRGALNRLLFSTRSSAEATPPSQPFFKDRHYWHFALSLTAVTGAMWLEGNGYRFVLERYWSAETLGVFLVSLSVPAQMTSVMESFIFQYVYPYFFRNLNGVERAGQKAEVSSALTGTLLPLYWAWGGLLLVMAPQFLFLLAGPAYHAAAQWVVFGCLLEVARLTVNAFTVIALANKDYKPFMGPFTVGAVGSLLSAVAVQALDLTPWMFGLGLVAAAGIKAALVAWRANQQMALRLPVRRRMLGLLVLLAGAAAQTWTAENHGPWLAFAVLLLGGTAAVALGYLHLRTVPAFVRMVSVRLS
ncbi:hypothetical protein [Sulfuricystis multivorans]|uniref:hypothetical protein n=1 Tax=Sulfuricystis multivorans TaxID=2211108 RepID=UPI000F832BDF|nr:hypothetical protein [Sulfuricystis multivorans]